MKITSIDRHTTYKTKKYQSVNFNPKVSFGAAKPTVRKSVLKNLLNKISNFNLSNYLITIKEKKELAKFKNTLKYDKTFPKNKIAQIFENASIKDIKAREEFYKFSKYNDFLPKGISEDTRIAVMSKVDENNLNLTKRLYDDPYFPKDKIPSILEDKDSSSFRLKENFYNRIRNRYDNPIYGDYKKMEPYMNDLAFLMQQTDKEYLSMAETLCKNPSFNKGAVLEVLHNPDVEDIKAVKEIYSLANKNQYKWNTIKEPAYHIQKDVRVPAYLVDDYKDRTGIIRNFVYYTTKDNLKTAKELCNSDKLTPELVANTLKMAVQKEV